ncbi:hypothetical protein, partial [Salmonella enterica]|uniref:hypothetical protein n=1 Tax=Salmonella enterica TaxID=28901 RepID=UPI0007950CFF
KFRTYEIQGIGRGLMKHSGVPAVLQKHILSRHFVAPALQNVSSGPARYPEFRTYEIQGIGRGLMKHSGVPAVLQKHILSRHFVAPAQRRWPQNISCPRQLLFTRFW